MKERFSHRWQTHQWLEIDSPEGRDVHLAGRGPVIEIPEVGGLHHHYKRVAA
jgi:hypothetical protein